MSFSFDRSKLFLRDIKPSNFTKKMGQYSGQISRSTCFFPDYHGIIVDNIFRGTTEVDRNPRIFRGSVIITGIT